MTTPFTISTATPLDIPAITTLIATSVRTLQAPDYAPAQIDNALATVFTVDTQLIADGTYFLARAPSGELAGCGGWSFRKTLYGGDHDLTRAHTHPPTKEPARLNPLTDAAKIRAIFVHPSFARQGLGSLLLAAAEDAAIADGFTRFEMGSTLTGVTLYTLKGYRELSRTETPIGAGQTITVVHMTKDTRQSNSAS